MENTPCVFEKGNILVLCYVDYLVLFSKHESLLEKTLSGLKYKAGVKDLREPTSFLCSNITWKNDASRPMS